MNANINAVTGCRSQAARHRSGLASVFLGLVACGLVTVLPGLATVYLPPTDAVAVRVSRVVDGDTVVLTGSGIYVRYLGIDTPEEGQPFYYSAKSANRDLVWRQDVYLEFGPERYDAYGRWLAYLWVQVEGQWVIVNEELLRRGLAKLLVFWPGEEKHYDRFRRAVTLAQVEKLGLWDTFPDPLPLAAIEVNPVKYVRQAVTVVFRVAGVALGREGWVVTAQGSRHGFHVVVDPALWDSLACPPETLVGRTLAVTGELRWETLAKGPRIWVWYPEQIGHPEGK